MPEERFVELTKLVLDKSLIEGRTTHRTELFILTLKSLLPSEDELGVNINYDRYNKEFLLWKYYRESSNKALDNILFRFNREIYFKEDDDSIIYRLMPLVLTNCEYKNLYNESIKNILYTTGNLNSLIESILITKLLYLLVNKYSNITESLKDEIISLNQKDFIDSFSNFYRVSLDNYEGTYQIDFEKAKIMGINILNGVESPLMKNFSRLFKIYLAMEDEDSFSIVSSLIKSFDEGEYSGTEISYFNDLGRYLYNIRKSKINPKALIIENYIMPDIFKYEKGEWFDHSLLNRCQVIDKEILNDLLYVRLKTKSGIYNFRKPIKR